MRGAGRLTRAYTNCKSENCCNNISDIENLNEANKGFSTTIPRNRVLLCVFVMCVGCHVISTSQCVTCDLRERGAIL